MKIFTVSTLPYQVETFLKESFFRLKKEGWKISVVCSPKEGFGETLEPGIKYHPLEIKRGISVVNAVSSIWYLYRLFREERPDFVQYTTTNASLYAAVAAWMARVPVRLYKQWGIRYVGFNGIKRQVFRFIERLICTLSTDIQPDSFGNLDFSVAERLYPSRKGSVVWNGSASGVNISKFDHEKKQEWRQEIREQLGIAEGDRVVGFVGRITPEKGINELLRAMKKLFEEESNLKLVIVGWADQADQLEKGLFEWAKESTNVFICGATDEVEKYYAAMDVFVLPSYREGFGSVVIEAAVMALPVIVTDIPGPREAVLPERSGLVVEARSTDLLYGAIKVLIQDEQQRAGMGKIGREFAVNHFEQQELFEKMVASYYGLLNKKIS